MVEMGLTLTKLILIYLQWVGLILLNHLTSYLIKVLQNLINNNRIWTINHIYQVAKKYRQEPDKDKEAEAHLD